jgi:hypothetical protein
MYPRRRKQPISRSLIPLSMNSPRTMRQTQLQIMLTVTACLLFWNGAINFEIGEFKTQPAAFKNMGSACPIGGIIRRPLGACPRHCDFRACSRILEGDCRRHMSQVGRLYMGSSACLPTGS